MMNRHERRAAAAQRRKKPLPPARVDGRPLYYDITTSSRVNCYHCVLLGNHALYGLNEAFMNDPANSPDPDAPGDVHTICRYHLPENAVIYNPGTNLCRNKAGDNTWQEDAKLSDPTKEIVKRATGKR